MKPTLFSIQTTTTGGTVTLTDLLGIKIIEEKQETTNKKLETTALARGVYFLEVIIAGERIVKQVVKQ